MHDHFIAGGAFATNLKMRGNEFKSNIIETKVSPTDRRTGSRYWEALEKARS
jgi:hypothetical protein